VATRSPHNDRYKTDLKGKTKKSASSAKPSRGVGDLSSKSPAKKPGAKKPRWGRGPSTAVPAFETTPQMKQLRRLWWVLWGLSLLIAVGILLLQKAGETDTTLLGYVPFAWGLWAATMAGAFYLEFTPIRKARMAAIEAARAGHKKPKGESNGKKKGPAVSDDAAQGAPGSDATPGPEDK